MIARLSSLRTETPTLGSVGYYTSIPTFGSVGYYAAIPTLGSVGYYTATAPTLGSVGYYTATAPALGSVGYYTAATFFNTGSRVPSSHLEGEAVNLLRKIAQQTVQFWGAT